MPKLTYGTSEIRTLEILHQPEAQYSCHADSNKGIAGKITVDLERKQ